MNSKQTKLQRILRLITTSPKVNRITKGTNVKCSLVGTRNGCIPDFDLGIPGRNEIGQEKQPFPSGGPELKPKCGTLENGIEGQKQLQGVSWYERGLKIRNDKKLIFEDKLNEVCGVSQTLENDFPESTQNLSNTEKQYVKFEKKLGCDQKSMTDDTETKVNNFIDDVDYTKMAKEDQNLQHTARAITNQVITDALVYRCNEEIQKGSSNTDMHTKLIEKEEDRSAQVEKEMLQKEELIKLQQKLEKVEKVYEEIITENRQLRERIGELRKENKDSHWKFLEERATWVNSQTSYRFKMKEMEKNTDDMQRTTISLEREIEKLEHKCKFGESKIAKLEVQINMLDDRLEEKDLLIEQLLQEKYQKHGVRGFLGCF